MFYRVIWKEDFFKHNFAAVANIASLGVHLMHFSSRRKNLHKLHEAYPSVIVVQPKTKHILYIVFCTHGRTLSLLEIRFPEHNFQIRPHYTSFFYDSVTELPDVVTLQKPEDPNIVIISIKLYATFLYDFFLGHATIRTSSSDRDKSI
ncbi:hypothetical protein CDAR_205481 [Caerostris darwini]|uniref:Uncharacterized protein n=1 Tax=Caerostris darwini TaxID=1538125 RepID=A0AAV4WRT2_9ARAC|nr:hypothetical protein CDAR_205481 [Caerostris darwini]